MIVFIDETGAAYRIRTYDPIITNGNRRIPLKSLQFI